MANVQSKNLDRSFSNVNYDNDTDKLEAEIAAMEAKATGKAPVEFDEDEVDEVPVTKEPVVEDEKVEDKEPKSAKEELFEKRYGDLRTHSNKQKQEYEARIKALEEGNTQPNLTSKEDLQAWMSENEEAASLLSALAQEEAKKLTQSYEDRFADMDKRAEELTRKESKASIMEYHKDFDAISESDEFHEWIGKQPKILQEAVFDNPDDAMAVVRVLDLYKVDNKIKNTSRKKADLEAATSISTKGSIGDNAVKGPRVWSESIVNSMSDVQYEKHEAEIMNSMADDTFVYDMSGGAR